MKKPDAELEIVYRAPSESDEKDSWTRSLDGAHFAEDVGLAFGTGQLLRTFNKGRIWHSIKGPDFVHNVFCIDTWSLYVLAGRTDSSLWHSTDGGSSWTELVTDLGFSHEITLFNKGTKLGLLKSSKNAIPARLLLQRSDSDKWTELKLSVMGEPQSVLFLDEMNGLMMVGVYGPEELEEQKKAADLDESVHVPLVFPREIRVLVTSSGGQAWEPLATIPYFLSDWLYSNEQLFAFGRGGIFRSSDIGRTWTELPIELPDGASVNAMAADSGHLIAVGDFGFIADSKTNGSHWDHIDGRRDAGNFIAATLRSNELIAVGQNEIRRIILQV
jgi:photosystem II stability/assembly factor-like uncharacterized protein